MAAKLRLQVMKITARPARTTEPTPSATIISTRVMAQVGRVTPCAPFRAWTCGAHRVTRPTKRSFPSINITFDAAFGGVSFHRAGALHPAGSPSHGNGDLEHVVEVSHPRQIGRRRRLGLEQAMIEHSAPAAGFVLLVEIFRELFGIHRVNL